MVASLQGGAGAAVPPEYLKAFATLTDHAASTPYANAIKVTNSELGAGAFQKLLHIEPAPVATGSLAQVHKVIVEDMQGEAAVKIQHARLAEQVAGDLSVFKTLGGMIKPG